MRKLDSVRLLGDQVLVRCLGTADKQGRIFIPQTAQEGRKIHQSGGDYLHRGEVLKVGPGDKTLFGVCIECFETTERIPRRRMSQYDDRHQLTVGKCHKCGGELSEVERLSANGFEPGMVTGRAPMPVAVGDIVLYENRRDAELRPTRFEFEGLEDQTFVVLLAEQHILAVLDEAVAA